MSIKASELRRGMVVNHKEPKSRMPPLILQPETCMLLLTVAALSSFALGQTTQQNSDVASLVQSLNSKDWQVRREAANSLRKMGVKAAAAIPALAERGAKDKDINVRSAAILALIDVGRGHPKQVVPVLIVALNDDFSGIRVDAVEALRKIGPAAKDAVPELIRMMDAPSHGASIPHFAGALDKIGVDVPTLVGLMDGKAEWAGKYAVEAMAKLGNKAVPDLVKIIKSGSPIGQARAATAIGRIGPAAKDAIPALAGALSSPEASVREAAVRAIGQMGPPAKETTKQLLKLLKSDKSDNVRAAAAKALGAIAPAQVQVISALTARLSDKDLFVRIAAADALGRFGADAKSAVPALVRALKDENWSIRAHAFEALGKIGKEAKAALPEMLKVIRTPFPYKEYGFTAIEAYYLSAEEAAARATAKARWNAVKALGKIAPDSKEVFAAVLKAADSSDLDVKSAALETLADFGKMARDEAAAVLFRALKDKGEYTDISCAVLETLKKIGTSDPATIRLILKMPPEGVVGVGVMKKLGPEDKALIPDLMAALKSVGRHVPEAAIAGLAAIGTPAIPELIKAFNEGDRTVADYAAEAISGMGAGAKPAIPELVKALGNKDRWKAAYAASAIRNIGPHAKEALPALFEMIRERKPGRTGAIGVIGALKPEARTTVPLLVGIAKDTQEDAKVRSSAIVSLAWMGTDAKEALPALRELIKDEKLGRYASVAVSRIEGKKDE